MTAKTVALAESVYGAKPGIGCHTRIWQVLKASDFQIIVTVTVSWNLEHLKSEVRE